MTPVVLAAVLMILVGSGGLWLLLWPLLQRTPSEEAPVAEAPVMAPGPEACAPVEWTRRLPMLPDTAIRVAAPFQQSSRDLCTEAGVGLAGAPLLEGLGPDVVTGRSFGRPVHAVRIEGSTYLDLVEAVRWLPRVLTAVGESEARAMFGEGEPVEPGGPAQAGTYRLQIGDRWLEVETRGGEWGGEARFDGHRQSGATADALLAEGRTGIEAWQWTPRELMELVGLGERMEQPVREAMVAGAFADRTIPDPTGMDERTQLLVPAALNWAGVVWRRAGRLGDAAGAFTAGLSVCAPDDTDNRGDLLFNRARVSLLQTPPDPEAALVDLRLASGMLSHDREVWMHLAAVHKLLQDPASEADAWRQAATRTRDLTEQRALLERASAVSDS